MGSKSDMTPSFGLETVHQAYSIDYDDNAEEDFIDLMDSGVGFSPDSVHNDDSFVDSSYDNDICEGDAAKGNPTNGRKSSKRKLVLTNVGKAKYKSSKNRKEPWSCQFCERKFTQRSSKHRHEKLHLGLKPHKCRFCEKAFTRKYILDEHERIHTGERPHQCTVGCGASYTLKSCLRKHELEHFGGQTHECLSCSGEAKPITAATTEESSLPKKVDPTLLDAALLEHEQDESPRGISNGHDDGVQIDDMPVPREEPLPETATVTNGSEMDKQKLPSPGVMSDSQSKGSKRETSTTSMKSLSQLISKRPAKTTPARRHKCYQCGKSFGSSRVLQMHKRVHESDGRFRCRFCGKAFSMRTVLNEHENQHKLMEEQSYSPMPSAEGILRSFLKEAKEAQEEGKSEKQHQRQLQSPVEPLSVETDDSRQGEGSSLPPEKPYMCLYCMKAFRHTCRLVKHAKKYRGSCFDPTATRPIPRNATSAPKAEVISPTIIGASLKKKVKKSKKSTRDHVNSNYYRCNVCSMTFSQRISWQIHKRKHIKEKQHPCRLCEAAFAVEVDLIQHHQDEHAQLESPVGDQTDVDDLPNNGLENSLDEMPHLLAEPVFEDVSSSPDVTPGMDDMIDQTTQDVAAAAGPDQEVFACVYCSKTFPSFDSLRGHQEELHQMRSFACPRCSITFSNPEDLQAHSAIHADERLYRCQPCKRSFLKEDSYRRHQAQHGRDKRHRCSYCPKTFERNSYRLQHERIHTGERPFTCRFCAKTFAQRNSMQRHEIIHLGIKKYRCDICEKAFGRRESLQNHILTHTKGIKVKLAK